MAGASIDGIEKNIFFVNFWVVYGCKVSVGGPAFFSIFRSTKNVWREVE